MKKLIFSFNSLIIILIIIFFCLCCCCHPPGSVSAAAFRNNETDWEALMAFKAGITSDPFGFLTSWNHSVPFCLWPGVTCNRCWPQRVTALVIQHQKLTGPLSPYIGNMSFLRTLSVANNSLSHEIPQLGALCRLHLLYLNNNSFTGDLPANLSACTNMEWLDVGWNSLSGKIPVELGSLSKLTRLFVDNNDLTGGIPPSFGNLSSLVDLYASYNHHLGGSIPSILGKLKNLQVLALYENNISGVIPFQIYNLSSLTVLDVGQNHIHGSLPPDMGNTLPNLNYFSITSNHFVGHIPTSISNMSNLSVLQVNTNQLTGNVPTFHRLQQIRILNLADNHFGSRRENDLGFISSLSNATNLAIFASDSNNFGGTLPESIGNLSAKLSFLTFENNHISGSLPTGLRHLVNLEVFSASQNFSAFFVNGNSRLCGGIPEMELPLCPAKTSAKKRRPSPTLRIIIFTALGLLGITSGLGILLCCWLRKKKKEHQSSTPEISSLIRISFQSLVNATNGFASTNLIGVGSFGSVYKGILEDGKAIAVKVLNLHRHGALKSFMAECEALRNIRHRNLVRVLSACSSTDYQGNDFKALVYELMVNGSLDEWLHLVQLDDV